MLLSTYLFAILDQLRLILFVTRRSFTLWLNNVDTNYCADYFVYTNPWFYDLLGKLPVKYQLELRAWFLIRGGTILSPSHAFVKKMRRSLKNTSSTQYDYIFHWVRRRWPLYSESTSSYWAHQPDKLSGFELKLLDMAIILQILCFRKDQLNKLAGFKVESLPRQKTLGRLFGLPHPRPIILSQAFVAFTETPTHPQTDLLTTVLSWCLRKTQPFRYGSTPRFEVSFLYAAFRKYEVFAVGYIYDLVAKTYSFGFSYLQGFLFLLLTDACLTDDEPLWEPVEWSLVQSWILFIFCFAWIAENLIVSRYGSYTGRDKRVWMAWYKTFWLIEGYYAVNYGIVCLFIIVPFYFELNYSVSFVYSWWHWYSRVFFFF